MGQIKIAVFGASGHAKVVIESIQAVSCLGISAVYDDDIKITDVLDYNVIGPIPKYLPKNECAVIAIGDNKLRSKIAEKSAITFTEAIIHPNATIGKSAQIKRGTVVMANAVINADAQVGKHCIINTGAIIEHEVILENYVHISPNAVITGNVSIGEGTHFGAGATVIPGIKIGKWSTIGAGAVIIEDVPDYATVVGNPGRIIK